jgi:hypothetical protein
MKFVKYSNSVCSFCEKKVNEYFTSLGKVICKDCVKDASEVFALDVPATPALSEDKSEITLEDQPCPNA